jgi:uncharacterized membrane protein YidH (DUF202 family)
MEHLMTNPAQHKRAGAVSRLRRAFTSTSVALIAALAPVLTHAQEGRALEASEDFGKVALVTLLVAGGILLLAGLGRLYQLQRGIRWRFQDPDAPTDGGH